MKKDKLLRKVVLLCIGLLTTVTSIKADYLPFRKIDVSNGLLNNQLWTIQQLEDHTFLIAYPYAFTLFDGAHSHICRFDTKDTYYINGFEARSFRDRKGRIWLKKYTSLFVYDPRVKSFVFNIQNLWQESGVGKIDDVLFDRDGNAWFYADRKIYFYDWKHKASMVYASSRQESKDGIIPVHVVKNGIYAMIVFSDGTIRRFCGEKLVAVDTNFTNANLPFLERASIVVDNARVLLGIGSKQGGLVLYNIKTGQYQILDNSLSHFINILRSPEGDIYIVCPYEIIVYSKEFLMKSRIQGINAYRTFESQAISSATFDWQGGLWVSTFLGGIYYYHPMSSRTVAHSAKIDKADNRHLLTSILDGGAKSLLYTTITDLIRYDISKNEEQILYHDPSVSILSMSKDAVGRIWLGTRQGIICLIHGQIEKYNANNVKNTPIKESLSRFALAVGDKVYCSMGGHTIGWINLRNREFHTIPIEKYIHPIRQDFWNAAYDKRHHKVLFAGGNCIISYDEKTNKVVELTQFLKKQNYAFSHANHIMVDGKGRYFISSQEALYIMTPYGNIHSYTTADGLPSGSICATAEMANGWYAITTSTAIATFYIDDNQQIHVRRYDISHLMDGNDLTTGNLVVKSGALWCASIDGFYGVLSNANISNFRYKEKFIPSLTGITVMNKEIPIDGYLLGNQIVSYENKHIHLKYNENFIELNFSACNYIDMSQTTYRYQLDKVDREWIERNSENGVLKVAYTNLSPSKYKLKIQVLDKQGYWTPSTIWTIEIDPPLWFSWWAILLYIITGIGLLYITYKIWKDRHSLLMKLKEKRNHFLIQAQEVKAEDMEITSEDELFLKKAVKFVENNLQNADYNVEALSTDMALNRSHFYRRLKAISGQAPTEFIRTIRLRRAAQLLSESGMTISEITFLCGFNSPAFFRKYFKDVYGMTPSEYKAKQEENDET